MEKITKIILPFLLTLVLIAQAPANDGAHNPAPQLNEKESEKKERKHTVMLELGGYSLPYSVGYGYMFREDLELRAGIGYLNFNSGSSGDEFGSDYFRTLSIPLVVSYLLGESPHRMELSAGLRFLRYETDIFSQDDTGNWNKWYISPGLGLGYRYSQNRFLFNASLQLLFMDSFFDLNTPVLPAFGLRFGYRI